MFTLRKCLNTYILVGVVQFTANYSITVWWNTVISKVSQEIDGFCMQLGEMLAGVTLRTC